MAQYEYFDGREVPIRITDQSYLPDTADGTCNMFFDDKGSVQYQQIKIRPTEQGINKQRILLHELTHTLQMRQGGDGSFVKYPEKKFAYNRLMEAEARLNTIKFMDEAIAKNPNINVKEHLCCDERFELDMYRVLRNQGLCEGELNKRMLDRFYENNYWLRDYHDQSTFYSSFYRETTNKDEISLEVSYYSNISNMTDTFCGRLKLSRDDIAKYMDVKNIPDFNKEDMKPYILPSNRSR